MKYEASAPFTLQPGAQVKLTEAQQRRCQGLVEPAEKKGWFQVTHAIQFKTGEVFETDLDLPKMKGAPEGEAPKKKGAADHAGGDDDAGKSKAHHDGKGAS